MSDFKHGDRVYHRVRKQYGTVVVHDRLDTDYTSVCIQFDGVSDIQEVSKFLVSPASEYPEEPKDIDEQLQRLASLVNDPHPGLLTWRDAFTKILREIGFEPIQKHAREAAEK